MNFKLPTSNLCGDELGPRGCGDYACRGVPLPKKKGERHDRAERCGRKTFRERQHHRRVSARFRREFDRVIDCLARFGVRRLPRGRDLVRGGVVGEVCSAYRYLSGREYFLVFGTADGLDVLNVRAGTRRVHACPVELGRLAAKPGKGLNADVDFVAVADHPRFKVDRSRQFGVNTQPAIKVDVASVHAETLNTFEEAVHDAQIRMELATVNVAVLHRELKAARRVVAFLVDDQPTENRLREITRILPHHHAVVQGRPFGRGSYGRICHNQFPFLSSWVRLYRLPALTDKSRHVQSPSREDAKYFSIFGLNPQCIAKYKSSS